MTPRIFARDESAAVSVEAVITIPVLLYIMMMMFVWWDGYRSAMVAEKASFTISDIISREPTTIDQAYINGMNTLFSEITRDSTTSIRVSVVQLVMASNGVDTELQLNWSHVAGTDYTCHTDMTKLQQYIPALGLGDEMIVIETHSTWEVLVSMGFVPQENRTLVSTSPRFGVPQVLWGGGSCAVTT